MSIETNSGNPDLDLAIQKVIFKNVASFKDVIEKKTKKY